MPSESQRKLKSFIRNSFIFPGAMKHGTTNNTSPSNSLADTNRKTTFTTDIQPGTRKVTSQQGLEETRQAIGANFPNAASHSCPYTTPRVPTLPRLSSSEHVQMTMASHRQFKKGKEKVINEDHRSQTHPLRRHPHGLSVNDGPDNDKNKVPTEKLNATGPVAQTEFERLRKEIELLKRTVHEQRRVIKKQSKRNEELKSEVSAGFAALTEKDAELTAKVEELRKMKDKFGKVESAISSLEMIFQCQVCIELLHRPYVLSPCGHVFCLPCLQEWFRRAPAADYEDEEDLDNPRYVLRRPKSCPCCRTKITQRPIPLFVLKAATNALAASRAQVLGTECRSDSPVLDKDEDPWKGIFPSSGDNEDSTSDEESSSESAGADSLAESDDRLSVHFTHYTDDLPDFGFESGSGSGNLSDRAYSDDNHGYGSDDDDIYVRPRWQPAFRYVNFYSAINNHNGEINSQTVSLLRRGCPLQMILSFRMTYSRGEGIIAYVPSFDSTQFLDDGNTDVEVETMNRVFLGWNIEIDEDIDNYGCHFMQRTLSEMDDFPERWEVRLRVSDTVPMAGVYDAIRLVRLSEVEEYDSDLASYLEGVELD